MPTSRCLRDREKEMAVACHRFLLRENTRTIGRFADAVGRIGENKARSL